MYKLSTREQPWRTSTHGVPARRAFLKYSSAAVMGLVAIAAPINDAMAQKAPKAPTATADKTTLKAGSEGTLFESLVIEGEDRVQVEFARPQLDLNLDYRGAMRFDFGDTHEVVERAAPDVQKPFMDLSASQRSPFLGRPWLQELSSGPIARFRPELDNVASWKLEIADSRSATVRVFEGQDRPPAELEWDGRATDGSMALPGLTYSYSLEAFDEAGNKRTFVGEGFQVPSYRTGEKNVTRMVIGGADLVTHANSSVLETPPVLLDAASWINQAEIHQLVQVVATARTFEQADALGNFVTRHLQQHVLGPDSRLLFQADVQPTAPAHGAVTLAVEQLAD